MLRELENLGLDMSNLVGLVFDGVANKSGKIKALQVRISAKIPTAQYVRCRHISELVSHALLPRANAVKSLQHCQRDCQNYECL